VVKKVYREKQQSCRIVALSHDFFCAVSVVHIDVNNSTTFTQILFLRNGMKRSSGHIVKDTKPA
jgi:hypothetical protein